MFSRLLGTEPLQARTVLLRDLVGDGRLAGSGDFSDLLEQAVDARIGPDGWILRDLVVPGHALDDPAWLLLPPDVVATLPLSVDCSGRAADLQAVWRDLRALSRLAAHVDGRLRVRHVRVAGTLLRTVQDSGHLRAALDHVGAQRARLHVEVDASTLPLHLSAWNDRMWSWFDAASMGLDLRWPVGHSDGVEEWLVDWLVGCVERQIPFDVAPQGHLAIPDDMFDTLLGVMVGAMLLSQGAVSRAEFEDLVVQPSPVDFHGVLLRWHGRVLTAHEIQLLRTHLVLGCSPIVTGDARSVAPVQVVPA